jgi:small subunit ribosomal protein S6
MEMRTYEAMLVVHSSVGGDAKSQILESLKEVFTKCSVKIISQKEWGKKRLSFEINKSRDGYYFFYQFEMEPKQVSKIKRFLTLNNYVLTYLIIQNDNLLDEETAGLGEVKSERKGA